MKKLSILIPLVNEFDALFVTIQGLQNVLGNRVKDIELIIKSVESPNKYLNKIKDYGLDVKFLFGPDSGIYDALNAAKSCANGDFIFCCSATEIFSDKFLDILDFLNCGKHDLVFTSIFVDDLKNPLWLKRPNKVRLNFLLYFLSGMPVCHQGLFVRQDCWIDFDPRFKIIGDQVQLFNMITRNSNIRLTYLESTSVTYRRDGISSNNPVKMRKERIAFLISGLLGGVKNKVQYLIH